MVLSSLFGSKKAGVPEDFTMVVDGLGLAPGAPQGDNQPPRAVLGILQQCSKIAKQENWVIVAVFPGDELEKVPHNADFLGVRVVYSGSLAKQNELLIECCRQLLRNEGVLLVSDDAQAQASAKELGARTLRASTFKKSYEELFTVRRRPQSRLARRRTELIQQQMRDDSVNDLIDLVD